MKERIANVIAMGQQLRRGNQDDQVHSQEHAQQCVAWFAPAQNVIEIVCPNPDTAYRKRAEEIAKSKRGLRTHTSVGELPDLLSHLLVDIEGGLLSSVVDRVRSEAFDDFLGHSEARPKPSERELALMCAPKRPTHSVTNST